MPGFAEEGGAAPDQLGVAAGVRETTVGGQMHSFTIRVRHEGWDYLEVLASSREHEGSAPGRRLLHLVTMESEEGHLALERLLEELLSAVQAADELQLQRRSELQGPVPLQGPRPGPSSLV